jgi:DNA-binding HxlR family transcriptional regulator
MCPTATEVETRAGSQVLSLFENPLNSRILEAHADGPLRLTQLLERITWCAETTLRVAISNLCDVGALKKETISDSPHAVGTALTPAGDEMLLVADRLASWLARCPKGPIPPDSEIAKGAIKALAAGWTSALMRVLADGPFTLTQMDNLLPGITYPSLERRVSKMRATGLIEIVKGEGRGTPYVATDWLRWAMAPLCLAGRCERRHMDGISGPVTNVEVEAAFLLSLPLTPLPSEANGACMLAIQTDPLEPDDSDRRLAGVTIAVRRGEVVSCVPEVEGEPTTWAVGTPEDWLDAVIDGKLGGLRIGGAVPGLPAGIVSGIHYALFVDP